MSNKVKAGAGAVVVVALLTGLWFVARAGVSPEQRLADAKPPPAAVATGVLEERVLKDAVVVRGRVVVPDQVAIRGPQAPSDGAALVVDLPVRTGDEVANGDVVAVVADRPVIVLEMPVGMWRGLLPGDEGPDVKRFQEALVVLGYPSPTDGKFGPVTQNVVRQLYRDRGFEAPETVIEPTDGAPIEEPEMPETDEADGEAAPTNAHIEPDKAKPEKGVTVPRGEMVGVAGLPATVSALPVAIGDELGESPLMMLSPSDYVIRAEVEPERAALLPPGTTGVAETDGIDNQWEVEVIPATEQDVGGAPNGSGDGEALGEGDGEMLEEGVGPPTASDVTFAPSEPFEADMQGRSMRVEVTSESTDGPVLAAPIAAIRTNADGEYLRVVGDDGEPQRVPIQPGASIGGWVELIDPEALEPGMTVLLG